MLPFSRKSSRKNTCIGANNIDVGGRGIKCHFCHIFCPGLYLFLFVSDGEKFSNNSTNDIYACGMSMFG